MFADGKQKVGVIITLRILTNQREKPVVPLPICHSFNSFSGGEPLIIQAEITHKF